MRPPPMRYVDIVPVDHEGQPAFCISDPEGFVAAEIVVSPAVLLIASQLDGVKTAEEVQEAFAEQSGGAHIPIENITEIVAFLDAQGFLVSDTYFALRREATESYRSAPIREAYFAGRSYPDDPRALRRFLDECFLRPDGPGHVPASLLRGEQVLRGLVVPHIDYHRGGHSYAHGYARLAAGKAPKTVLVFGVAHQTPPVPFILTSKSFDTPLGVVETDTAAVDHLAAACDWDPFEYELTHRTEHSIEFHAVMLRYLYGPDVTMVPILCGHFDCDDKPDAVPQIAAFLDACREIVAERGDTLTVLASADFSHMGKRFGDDYDIDDAILATIASRDNEDLQEILRFDSNGWYRALMRDGNARRVCGINCIYSTLYALGEGKGELLHYDAAPDPAGGVVSFASVALQ